MNWASFDPFMKSASIVLPGSARSGGLNRM
jgi:hypothetical protein